MWTVNQRYARAEHRYPIFNGIRGIIGYLLAHTNQILSSLILVNYEYFDALQGAAKAEDMLSTYDTKVGTFIRNRTTAQQIFPTL